MGLRDFRQTLNGHAPLARSQRPQYAYRGMIIAWAALLLCASTSHGLAQTEDLSREVTLEDLQTRLKHAQAETELEPKVKQQVIEVYQSAIERLELASEATANTQKFLQRIDTAPAELVQLKQKLSELPERTSFVVSESDNLDDLERMLAERRRQIDDPEHGLQRLAELAKRRQSSQKSRLEEITKDLAEIEERLASIQELIDAPPPQDQSRELTSAIRLFLQSRRRRATEERTALHAEQSWYLSDAATELLRVQRDLAVRELSLADAEAQILQSTVDSRRGNEADQRVRIQEQAAARIAAPFKPAAEKNLLLAREDRDVAAALHKTNERLTITRDSLNSLKAEFAQSRTMVEAVGLTESIGLLLRQQRSRLNDTRGLHSRISLRGDTVRQTRLRIFQIEADLAALQDPDTAARTLVHELTAEESAGGPNPAGLPKTSAAQDQMIEQVKPLLDQRRELLERLNSDYGTHFEKLVLLDNDERKLLEETQQYAAYIDERVLWIRTGAVFGVSQFTKSLNGFAWLVDRGNWQKVVEALQVNAGRQPIPYAVALTGLLIWLVTRWSIRFRLQKLGAIAEEETCQELSPTIQAFCLTILLSVFIPVSLRFFGWRLEQCASTSRFVHAVAVGLFRAAVFAVPLEILRFVVMRGGIADKHFDWSQRTTQIFRRRLYWFIPIGIVLTGAIGMIEATADEPRLDTAGRFAFLIFASLLSLFCYTAFPRPLPNSSQADSGSASSEPSRRGTAPSEEDVVLARFSRAGRFLSVGIPLGLVMLCWTGYFYTALQLMWRLQATAWLVIGLILLRAFVQRWLKLEKRRMAILQAKELQAIEGASRQPGSEGNSPFLFPRWTWPDFRLNLSQIVTQVRSLLDTGLVTIAVIGLWIVWADVTPALNILDRFTLWQTTVEEVEELAPARSPDGKPEGKPTVHVVKRSKPITAADLGLGILLLSIAAIAARNIPGLVEVILLEHLSVDAGIRFATTCLVRYAIFTAGFVLAFNQIGIGWNSVQWLVAAASVGLGFGLQEIFANFVSGIILLFERPMRVGDVITIGGTTGTVSRIRFRATTIVDGDRKELVVPNKSFITGNLLNWTLSDSINRVAIKVGVAYGSDPTAVQETLLKIAADHPALLKDPAPTAALEELGDSALIYQLRAFLPNLKDRLKVTHELNSMIHDRFKAMGIEIPFPQQEVSLHFKNSGITRNEPATDLHGSLEAAFQRAGVTL